MHTKKFALFSFLFLIISGSVLSAQTPVFNALKANFDAGLIYKGAFSHTFSDSYTGEQSTNTGTIWIGKERYKISGDVQQMVVDGETSSVYDPQKNRVIISAYDPLDDDFAPSKTLNGVDSTYAISEKKIQNGETLISMISSDAFALFPKIEVTVNKNGIPLKIYAIDSADNTILTVFTGGEFISAAKVSFVLEYPSSAEIIDLRLE